MTPKISVVMPVYNAEQFLREAVNSVLHQTFSDFEFIMVDDCSKDNSWSIMMEYAVQDRRVVLVRNTENLGEAGARNAGHKLAQGEYIAAMDADDILFADRLALQVNYLDTHPEVGLVAGCAKRIDIHGNFISLWDIPSEHEVLRAKLLFNNPLPHPTVMMRRALVEEIGGYSSFFTTDYDLWWRMSKITRLAAIPQVVALIRITAAPDRISSAQAPKQLIYTQEMSVQIAQEIMGKRPLDVEAYRRFFMSSRGRRNNLIRFDVRRLQSLWDFVAADPVYREVMTPKLVSVALKLTKSQPVEAVSLLILLNSQFKMSWKDIAKKYVKAYLTMPLAGIRSALAKSVFAPRPQMPFKNLSNEKAI